METTKSEKIFKRLAIAAILIATVIWFYNDHAATKNWDIQYKKSSFTGIIKDTVHYPLQHDWPTYIFTNDSSHFSDVNEAYMQGVAKVGDSLSKVSGNDTVYIFRKRDSSQYIQIYPSR